MIRERIETIKRGSVKDEGSKKKKKGNVKKKNRQGRERERVEIFFFIYKIEFLL